MFVALQSLEGVPGFPAQRWYEAFVSFVLPRLAMVKKYEKVRISQDSFSKNLIHANGKPRGFHFAGFVKRGGLPGHPYFV